MNRDTAKRIAATVAKAGGDCPCGCHDPETCGTDGPFWHDDCSDCWTTIIWDESLRGEAEARADAIWAVLVGLCGASPDERDGFVHRAARTPGLEYRFRGSLGFGGKVYMECPPRVSCYREDENPKRLILVDAANAILAAIAGI